MMIAKPISLTHFTRAGEIAEYIQACCRQGNAGSISISLLSRRFALCQTNVKSAFKQRFNTSVHAYLIQEKFKHICSQLDQPHLTVKEIAVMNGYDDLSNFSRDFTRVYGITATQYRRIKLVRPAGSGDGFNVVNN